MILPCFNEAANLDEIVRRLRTVLDATCGADGYEILFVDDAAPTNPRAC